MSLPAFCSLAGRRAHSQSAYTGTASREYERALPDFLRDLAGQAYQDRNREIARLTSPDRIRRRQQWARETFWKLAGGMPQRTPLNTRTVGAFDRPGYRVEKLVYESVPGFHVSANLYIPTAAKPPFPGVLFQMGHAGNGKAWDPYQCCCQGLVKQGYLVLAFDPMGQGERVYYPDAGGRASRLSPDSEHTVPGRQMLLVGDTATRMQVWDAMRSLDLLAAHPQVDPARLGATGQSGGGTLTMLLVAVDDRLSAAVVCDGNTENLACANFNPPGSTDDAEQNLIGSGPLAYDRWDLLYPFAPKPLLIQVSDHDSIGTYSSEYVRNGWEEFGKLRAIYARLGAPDRLAWADTPLPHGLEYDSRLQVYNWFARWLKHETAQITDEPAVHPEAEQTLLVSDSGSMVRSFGSQTPFALTRARSVAPRPVPLDQLIGARRPETGLKPAVLREVPARGIAIQEIEVESAPHVWLPAWLYLPSTHDASRPLLLALTPFGRNFRWHEGELYQSMAARGYPVCVADLRGVGDLTPELGRGAVGYAREHDNEESYAWASIMLGASLLGQRATDVLALAAALRAHPGLRGAPLRVAASGRLAAPALFAAALDPDISQLYLTGSLVSYRSIIETEDYSVPFATFVPGILLHTDLPEIAASLAPRRLRLAGTVDATGRVMSQADVRAAYGEHPHIDIRQSAPWDFDALTEL